MWDEFRAAEAPVFRSLLFPPGLEGERVKRPDPPACFGDLNLDEVMAAVVAKRDAEFLLPIFYAACRNEEVIRYRRAKFADVARTEVFEALTDFCEALRTVRANLAYADNIFLQAHRNLVLLRGIGRYCDAVESLPGALRSLELGSAGPRGLRAYLAGYGGSPWFTQLATEARELRGALSKITCSMLFRGDKVTVRKYASEHDYGATILERFGRFKESPDASPVPPRQWDDFSLNHIEQGILEFVGRLYPEPFRLVADYVARHGNFLDDVVATLDREIGFFLAYLAYIRPLECAGLPFCYPDVSAIDKTTTVSGSFDIALAAKLVGEGRPVVRNDSHLAGPERLIVVSGPNQGGKTTFARMFGQLHVLAGLGCPVPGERARIFLLDRVFAHFEREEDIASLRG
jgi:hypothetical protein